MIRVLILLFLPLLLAGCGGQPTQEEEGFYTWVDESGQLRRTPIPGSGEEQDSDSQDVAETQDGEKEQGKEHPVYNLDNFPDGNEQLSRLEEQQPYYTWIDSQGNVHNTPYDQEAEAADPIIEPPQQLSASDARVARRGGGLFPDEGGEPELALLLDLDQQKRLVRFAERCCSDLSDGEALSLGEQRRLSLSFDSSQSHGFPERDSVYRLIRLPENASRSYIRLRSFIRDGAFVPSLAFLDADLKPTRLVTDIVFEHHPQTWRRRAFLQAHVPLRELEQTRWLLIYSEAEVGFESLLAGESGPVAIDHRPDGVMELKVVQPDQPSGASLLNQGWDSQ